MHWYDWLILGHAGLVTLATATALLLWVTARMVRVWLWRRLAGAVIATIFAALYLVLPFDFLLDPILVDDLAVLAMAGWQWAQWRRGMAAA